MFGGKYFCRRDRDKHNFTDKLPFGIASNKHPEVQQVVVFKGTKPKQIYIEMARRQLNCPDDGSPKENYLKMI